MARLPRTVVPGYPHHVTQRGNRRLPTFFSDDDYEAYLALMDFRDILPFCLQRLRRHGRTGRPLGRRLVPAAPGAPAGPAAGPAARARHAGPAEEGEGKIVLCPQVTPR